MKKYFLLMVAVMMAIVTMSLTACGSDKDDEPKADSSMVGTWKYLKLDHSEMLESLIQFAKDGKYYQVDILSGEDGDDFDIAKGTYVVSGNKITATGTFNDSFPFEYEFIYSVSGDKLTLTTEGVSYTFTKVSDSAIQRYLQ